MGGNTTIKTTRQLLVNEVCDDLTYEGYTMLAIMLEMVWAAQVVGERMSNALDVIGAADTLVQRKKKALNNAKEELRKFMNNIAIAFDDEFGKVCELPNGPVRFEYIQKMANDILKMLLIYYSRCDGDDAKRERMQKALMNFKGIPDLDLESMLNFYKFT